MARPEVRTGKQNVFALSSRVGVGSVKVEVTHHSTLRVCITQRVTTFSSQLRAYAAHTALDQIAFL